MGTCAEGLVPLVFTLPPFAHSNLTHIFESSWLLPIITALFRLSAPTYNDHDQLFEANRYIRQHGQGMIGMPGATAHDIALSRIPYTLHSFFHETLFPNIAYKDRAD